MNLPHRCAVLGFTALAAIALAIGSLFTVVREAQVNSIDLSSSTSSGSPATCRPTKAVPFRLEPILSEQVPGTGPAGAATWDPSVVPDQLVVTSNSSPYVLERVIAEKELIHQLYVAVLTLPRDNYTGIINCPMDIGISYALDFYANGKLVLHVDYDPTGCAFLVLCGEDRRLGTADFDDQLQQALGLSRKSFSGM